MVIYPQFERAVISLAAKSLWVKLKQPAFYSYYILLTLLVPNEKDHLADKMVFSIRFSLLRDTFMR